MEFKWKAAQYGEQLLLGRVVIGVASWNPTRYKSDSDDNKYVGNIKLPGFKKGICYGDSIEKVKQSVENMAKEWIAAAGLMK